MSRVLFLLVFTGAAQTAHATNPCNVAHVPASAAPGSMLCNLGGANVCDYTGTGAYDCALGRFGGGLAAFVHVINYTGNDITAWGQTANGTAFCCVEPLSAIDAGSNQVTVNGGPGNDFIHLTYADAVGTWELDGNAAYPITGWVSAKAGNDHIDGSAASGPTYGGEGLNGDLGIDDIFGRAGDDKLWGWDGDDNLYGGAGIDTIRGGNGDDYIEGNLGNDQINAGDGADEAHGGFGADTVCTDLGINDLPFGEDGNDILHDPAIATAIGDGGSNFDQCADPAWALCDAPLPAGYVCPVTP